MPKDWMPQETIKLINQVSPFNGNLVPQTQNNLIFNQRIIQQQSGNRAVTSLIIPEHNGPGYDIFKYVRNPELRSRPVLSKQQIIPDRKDSSVSLKTESKLLDVEESNPLDKHRIIRQSGLPQQITIEMPEKPIISRSPRLQQLSQSDNIKYDMNTYSNENQTLIKKHQSDVNSLHETIHHLKQQQMTSYQQYQQQLSQYKMYQKMIGEELKQQRLQNTKLRSQILDNQQQLFKVNDITDQIELNNKKIYLIHQHLKVRYDRMTLLRNKNDLAHDLKVELSFHGLADRYKAKQKQIETQLKEIQIADKLLIQQQKQLFLQLPINILETDQSQKQKTSQQEHVLKQDLNLMDNHHFTSEEPVEPQPVEGIHNSLGSKDTITDSKDIEKDHKEQKDKFEDNATSTNSTNAIQDCEKSKKKTSETTQELEDENNKESTEESKDVVIHLLPKEPEHKPDTSIPPPQPTINLQNVTDDEESQSDVASDE